MSNYLQKVSIPSRGSGKGDPKKFLQFLDDKGKFQSPLGEVVKETLKNYKELEVSSLVSIPSRGSGKGDF